MAELGHLEPQIDVRHPFVLARNTLIGAAAALVTTEMLAHRVLWRTDGTTIEEDVRQLPTEDRWLAVPGLELKSAQPVATAFHPVFPEHNIDYLKFDNGGTSPLRLSHGFYNYFRQRYDTGDMLPEGQPKQRQNAVLSSMGLATFLKAQEICIDQAMPVPPIDQIIAIDPTMHADDTYMAHVVRLLSRSHYPGGLLTKMLYEMKCGLRDRQTAQRSSAQACIQALRQTFTNCPPPLLTSKLRLLDASSQGYEDGIFAGVITPQTRVTLLLSDSDPVVKTEQSVRRVTGFFESYGAQVQQVKTGTTGHARTDNAVAAYSAFVASKTSVAPGAASA